jgi:hypothetical protein
MSLRFVVCIEAGRLEHEALLLCRSLRRFGGRLAESPVAAYRPRRGQPLTGETRAALAELGVELIEEEINAEHAFHPIANKVHAAAHAEREFGEESLAVLDSDAVILGEPDLLELGAATDAAAAPVGKVSEGTTGPDHDNEPYWQGLYELAGVTDPPWIETALRGARARGYWNSGLVAARREAGVLGEWVELFRRLLDEERLPPSGRIDNLDQIALALVLSRRPDRVATLPWPYNYRITRRGRYRGAAGSAELAELVHVHYMRSFYVEGFLERLEPPIDPADERYTWLAERLPLEPRVRLDDDRPLSSRRIRRALRGDLRRQAVEWPGDDREGR